MQTINLRIDVSKLDKNRLTKNTFTKKDGTVVNQVNADLVLVEKPEPRVIKEGDTWILKETHFIAEKRGKDESKNYVGVGSQFFDKNAVEANFGDFNAISEDEPSIDLADVPF